MRATQPDAACCEQRYRVLLSNRLIGRRKVVAPDHLIIQRMKLFGRYPLIVNSVELNGCLLATRERGHRQIQYGLLLTSTGMR